jgi:hypothetical protein
MGYRSEVAYGIKVHDIKWGDDATEEDKKISSDGIFLLMLTEMQQDELAGKCFDDTHEINQYLTINKENRTIVFTPDDTLKWYDDYEDVKAHERVYQIAEEYTEHYLDKIKHKNPVSCAFIRIGEDIDDIEERGSGNDPWSIMNITRGIDINI